MGRSGLAIAKSAKKNGAYPVVYDEQPVMDSVHIHALEQLDALGIPVVTSWHGHLDPDKFDFLVVSPGFGHTHPAINDMLAAGKDVLSEVEFAWRIATSPIIAITGTNGKSTTSVMTWMALKGAGQNAVLCGNISGSGYEELTLTEAADRSGPDDVLVAEISSFQLEWIKYFRPKIATITNITPDHLDRYLNFDKYFHTKLKLFENMGARDKVILNLDEPSLPPSKILDVLNQDAECHFFSIEQRKQKSDGSNPNVYRESDDLVVYNQKISLSKFPFCSQHQLTNLAQAFSLAGAFLDAPEDQQIQDMFESLSGFQGLQNRMEVLGQFQGVLVVNNSMCTNPMAVITSSKSLTEKQHLLIGGHPKNLDFSELRTYLKDAEHLVYVFGPNASEMNEKLGGIWPCYSTLENAFLKAADTARKGEAIMLAPGCASSFPFANFRERGDAFRQMVKNWMNSK